MNLEKMGDIRLKTPRLEMTASGEKLEELVRVAQAGVHEASVMPFGTPWTDAADPGDEVRSWWLRQQGKRSAEEWSLPFIVSYQGHVIGQQTVSARQFLILEEVSTGSWLGRGFQRNGFGTEMRAAVLHLAFTRFYAVCARTTAMMENYASRTINMKLGYRENGENRVAVRGQAKREVHYALERRHWLECSFKNTIPIEVIGGD